VAGDSGTGSKRGRGLSFANWPPTRRCCLALAGWYLMLLPNNGPGMATISPPVWSAIQHSYDTAKECEKARAKAVVPPASTGQAFYCVASDDPRLR
jgi:hypothetical protein